MHFLKLYYNYILKIKDSLQTHNQPSMPHTRCHPNPYWNDNSISSCVARTPHEIWSLASVDTQWSLIANEWYLCKLSHMRLFSFVRASILHSYPHTQHSPHILMPQWTWCLNKIIRYMHRFDSWEVANKFFVLFLFYIPYAGHASIQTYNNKPGGNPPLTRFPK